MTYRRTTFFNPKTAVKAISTAAIAGSTLLALNIPALTAAEFQGALGSVSITDASGANMPPFANFTYSQNGNEFTFDAGGSSDPDGSIKTYSWDFNNGGNNASGMTTSKTFAPGEHTVTLTVTDNAGGVTITQSTISYGMGTVIEDGEDGTISGWTIYDNDPDAAAITNEYDSSRQSRVIVLQGTKMDNGFALASVDGSPFKHTDGTSIEFSMNFETSYRIYVQVSTTAGSRYIVYDNRDKSSLGSGTYIYHGLGSNTLNGQWTTVTRDLQQDLAAGQPDLSITSIDKFLVRGSGSLDNIKISE